MRILVTGAGGLLGAQVVSVFSPRHEVVALYRSAAQPPPIKSIHHEVGDLADEKVAERLLSEHQPDLILNCAGASDVDRCEADTNYADIGNVTIVKNLIRASENCRARLLYISSDYVFDGKHGPAFENDEPRPINYYGKTKLMAEEIIRQSNINSTIIRVCSLYSIEINASANIFKSIAASCLDGKTYQAANDLYSNPTEVSDLAIALRDLIELDALPPLIHLAAPEYLSRYQFAQYIASYLGADKGLIVDRTLKDLNLPANRPANAGLNSTPARQLLGRELKTFSEITKSGETKHGLR